MDTKKSLTVNINLDGRILAVLLIVVGVLFWGYVQARAQAQGELTTNSPEEQVDTQPVVGQPETNAAPEAPEPGMLLTTNMEWIRPEVLGIAAAVEPASINANPTYPRHFYLTASNYATNAALTACGTGYHMASLWEMLDVTSLIYDYDHASAHTKADSGWGPPSGWNGWVRTGYASDGANQTGTGNCNNWSSVSSSSYGVSVKLSRSWEAAPGDIFVWDATSFACNLTGPVWCVKN